MSWQIFVSSRVAAYFALATFAVWAAPATAASIQDTFTRADSTSLGTTEVGGFSYIEINPDSPFTAETAEILSGELSVNGHLGATSLRPGIATVGASLGDISIAADMRYTFPNGVSNTSSHNYAGFVLRRNDGFPGLTSGANEGLIEIQLHAGGGLFVREVAGNALNILNFNNPFGGSSSTSDYSTPGTLPTTFNGLPFDANGNGRLEETEPFRFSADLVGNSLTIGVNGAPIANLITTASTSPNALSYAGLVKNLWSSGGSRDVATPIFDNLDIGGTQLAIPPILHVGDMHPQNVERWTPVRGGAGVANNGPVNDGGTPAWNIEDASTAGGSFANWQRALTPEQIDDALNKGWSMKGEIRVLTGADDVLDGAIELSAFISSDVGYVLWLGTDGFGQAVVGEFSGTVSGGLAVGRTATVGAGYNEYEMVFDPNTQEVDVFVNGGLVLDNMAPTDLEGLSINRILWGSNASAGVGNANYSFVEFSIVPEPSTTMMFVVAATCLCGMFRKRNVLA